MATSGTVGTTSLDVIGLIEKSIKKCGTPVGTVGSEQLDSFKTELFLLLSECVNVGVPLWTITKKVLGLKENQLYVDMPVGTIDVMNALHRYNVLPSGGTPASSSGTSASAFDQDLTTSCTQTASDGWILYDFGSDVVVTTLGLLPATTQALNPVYEHSSDGVVWITSVAVGVTSTYIGGQWYWKDVDAPASARYYRIRETSGGTLNLTELVFGQNANEIPMARINRDDYQNLPFKNNVGRPLQYWFDRQITPRMVLWPTSDSNFNTIVAWTRREIQDIGSYTNILEIPNRWLNDVTLELASRISLEIPGVSDSRIATLKALSQESNLSKWIEERDNSPVSISFGTRGYTR